MTGRSLPLVRSMVANECLPTWVEMFLSMWASLAIVLRCLLMHAVEVPMALTSFCSRVVGSAGYEGGQDCR